MACMGWPSRCKAMTRPPKPSPTWHGPPATAECHYVSHSRRRGAASCTRQRLSRLRPLRARSAPRSTVPRRIPRERRSVHAPAGHQGGSRGWTLAESVDLRVQPAGSPTAPLNHAEIGGDGERRRLVQVPPSDLNPHAFYRPCGRTITSSISSTSRFCWSAAFSLALRDPPGARGGPACSPTCGRLRRCPRYHPGAEPPDPTTPAAVPGSKSCPIRGTGAAQAARRPAIGFAAARDITRGPSPRTPRPRLRCRVTRAPAEAVSATRPAPDILDSVIGYRTDQP
jgi:hypothetical protein